MNTILHKRLAVVAVCGLLALAACTDSPATAPDRASGVAQLGVASVAMTDDSRDNLRCYAAFCGRAPAW